MLSVAIGKKVGIGGGGIAGGGGRGGVDGHIQDMLCTWHMADALADCS